MKQVIWAESARDELWNAIQYIAAENPDAAEKVADKIDATAQNLADYATGHPGRVSGTYEKSVTGLPYIIAYSIMTDGTEEKVAILRVIHTARNWGTGEWPA